MKKLFIILFILILLAVIGAVIFLMTLDVDKFRPQIVNQIENAVKKPVRLDKIKLGWQSGIALELRGLAILKNKEGSEALVTTGSAKAVLELAPLLSRQIQIATIYLNDPSISLVKKPDGTFEGLEPETPQPVRQESGTTPAPEAALSFLINKIRIDNGEVFFKDTSGKEPLEITLRKITINVDDVALDQPIQFDAQAAVFSPVQNIDLKGKLTVASKGFIATLNRLHGEMQLSPMDFQEIAKVNPAVKTSGIIPPLEGLLTVDLDSLKMDEAGLRDAAAKIRFDRGKVRLEALKGPVENIFVDVLATAALIKAQTFTADAARGRLSGQGAVNIADLSNPAASFDIKAEKLLVEELVPQAQQPGPQLKGLLSLAVRGNLSGSNPEQVKRTLNAGGTVVLDEGVLAGMNVLREVFQKLSVIPGLVDKLLTRLPENYREKLNVRDTRLKTIQLPFSVQNGIMQLPQINLATDDFQIAGAGAYGLEQNAVEGTAVLAIEPNLSGAMIRSVEELEYLTNAKKEVRIPLMVRGRVPAVAVMPDLQYIASQIAASKAKEMLSGYLKKALGEKETSAEGGAASTKTGTGAGETQPKSKGLLGDFLREGLKGITSERQAPAAADTQ